MDAIENWIYMQNIKIIKAFYSSDFYDECKKVYFNSNTHIITKRIIESMYLDPDRHDEKLFNIYKERIIDDKIKGFKYGLDGLCGWKQLYDYHKGNEEWLDDYKTIRSSRYGNLIWPNRIEKGGRSINQERYLEFGDRIDYTLFDIKLYYEEYDQCRLKKSYKNQETKGFLDSFKEDREKEKSFKNFIKYMGLETFTDGKDDVLDVLDLEFELGAKEFISKEKHQAYSFCARWPGKLKKQYLDNILSICKKDIICL